MPDWLLMVGYVLGSAWLFGNILTWPLQHFFIFRGKKLPNGFKYTLPRPHQEYWLDTNEQGRINIWWLEAATHSKGIILYCHGNSGNLASWNPTLSFLSEQSFDLVAFDYRGYGKSVGPRSQERLYADAEAVLCWLVQKKPDQPILLYGRSMGSTFATRAAIHPQVKMLVLETPFSSMKDLFYTYYPILPRIFYFSYPMPTPDYLKQVDVPVLVFHGTKDRIVPYRNARKLFPYLKESDAFFRIEGGGHLDIATFERYRYEMKNKMDRLF